VAKGGARPGAGRPRNLPTLNDSPLLKTTDATQFLQGVMADAGVDIKIRADAAKALLSAEMRKAESRGKKEAQAASSGKFSPNKPPLAVVK
jgi:phage terminase small subunit